MLGAKPGCPHPSGQFHLGGHEAHLGSTQAHLVWAKAHLGWAKLASFKLSYVSPENHKIEKSMMNMGNQKWSLEAKNGFRVFFVEWKLMF